MTFWAILILLLVVSGLVAYVGDRVAKWAGKKHWRPFGLRPRVTATLVAVTTGVVIGLGAFTAFFLSVREARETILEGETIRQERNQLRQEKTRFTREMDNLKTQINTLKGQAARIFAERDQFLRERDELATGQKNTLELLRQTEIQLQITKNEEAELAQEAQSLKLANQSKQAALLQAEEQSIAARAKLESATRQLQQAAQQSWIIRQEAQLDQQKLKQAQQTLKAAQQELKAAQTDLKEARLEVTDLQETRRELIRERVELDAARAKLERQAQEAGQRLQSLEVARKATQKQVAELEARAKALEAEKRELEGDVTVLQIAKNTPKPAAEAPDNPKATNPVVPKTETPTSPKIETPPGSKGPANQKAVKPALAPAPAPAVSPMVAEITPKTELMAVSKPEILTHTPAAVKAPLEPPRTKTQAVPVKPAKVETVPATPKTEAIRPDPEQEAVAAAPAIQPATPKVEVATPKPREETSAEAPKIGALTLTSKPVVPRTNIEALRLPVPSPDQSELIKALKANETALKASEALLKQSEATLKAEGMELKQQLSLARRENEQLKESRRLLLAGLEKVLRPVLLAEYPVEPGLELGALSEIGRRSELKARLWGFKGTEMAQTSLGSVERPGLLLARPVGVSPEGKVMVQVEFHPREQAFASGEILLVGGLILPSSPTEIRRRVALWERDAQDKLAQAGWIPEKLLQGGINLEEIVTLTNQIAGKRGGAKIGIVALDDLFTTEPPKLGLKVMP